MQYHFILVATSGVIDVAIMVMLLENVGVPVVFNAIIAIKLATIHVIVQTDNVTCMGIRDISLKIAMEKRD